LTLKKFVVIGAILIVVGTLSTVEILNTILIDEQQIPFSVENDFKSDIPVQHTIPQNNSIFQTGTEFLGLDGGTVWILFDNTNLYIDSNNDGVYDYKEVYNKDTRVNPSLSYHGTRLFSDKPIIYSVVTYAAGDNRQYNMIPPLHALKSDYIIPAETWYLGATTDLIVDVDYKLDGSIDQQVSISKLNGGTLTTSELAKVSADQPFYCYNAYTFVDTPGSDYYLQSPDLDELHILENDTMISLDLDNNGVYDNYTEYDKGTYTLSDITHGAHLSSSKPVLLIDQYNNFRKNYIPPSNTMSSDYYAIGMDAYGYGGSVHVIGCFNNVTLYGDYLTSHDLVADKTQHIGANEYNSWNWLSGYDGIHLWGTKPFSAWSYAARTYYYYYYFTRAVPSCITATTLRNLNELEGNQEVTMEIRVFNPTANTEIRNVTIDGPINDDFDIPGGGSLAVTIEKLYLCNDTAIANESFSLIPTHSNGNYHVELSKLDTLLFSNLGPLQYYTITYSIITPSLIGNYQFEPVEISYDASTWILPS